MTPSRILLTGATGLVGRQVSRWLVSAGCTVIGVSRRRPPASTAHAWFEVDLLDPSTLRSLPQAEVLVHLAWETGAEYQVAPANKRWAQASWDLIGAFLDSGGSRVVVAGSCAEYDWTLANRGHRIDEAFPLGPSTPYGEAKLELFDRASASVPDLAWARLFWLVGPGERAHRLVPSVARAVGAGEVIAVRGADHYRDFLSTNEAGRGISLLAVSDARGAFNIASGRPRRVGEVAREAAIAAGGGEIDWGKGEGPEWLVGDPSRARAEVAFDPDQDLWPAVRESVLDWRSHEDHV